MQKYFKLSFITFLISAFLISTYCIVSVYVNDPLQVFHKSFFNKDEYVHPRLSMKAIIRNFEFDSVIIGNSHSENTSAKTAQKFLKGEFFNISMAGSTMKEKELVLNYLFKQKNIKKVVYIADDLYIGLQESPKKYPLASYGFLYNDNPYDDYKIYMTYKYLFCALGFKKCTHPLKSLDKPFSWEDEVTCIPRFGGFENWLKYNEDGQTKDAFEYVLKAPDTIAKKEYDKDYTKKLHSYIDEYLIEIVKSNPNVEFNIVISPVTNLKLATDIRNGDFNKQEIFLRYLVENSSKYPNLKIFAFDNLKIMGKIEDFKDLTHYRIWVNDYIIKAIAQDRNRINKSGVNQYLKDTYNKAYSFDFKKYKKIIEKNI